MERIRRVVLYGRDLVVSSVGANLHEQAGFQVVQIDPLLPDAFERLDAACPEVILFDMAVTRLDFPVAVLRKYPSLLLIAIDLANDTMLVMSGEESRLLTVDDLVRTISGFGGYS